MKISNNIVSDALMKKLAEVGLPANIRVIDCDVGLFSGKVRLELDLSMTARNFSEAIRLAAS